MEVVKRNSNLHAEGPVHDPAVGRGLQEGLLKVRVPPGPGRDTQRDLLIRSSVRSFGAVILGDGGGRHVLDNEDDDVSPFNADVSPVFQILNLPECSRLFFSLEGPRWFQRCFGLWIHEQLRLEGPRFYVGAWIGLTDRLALGSGSWARF